MRRVVTTGLMVSLSIAWFVPVATGADRTWFGGTGNWFDPSLWGGVLPQASDRAYLNSGTAQVASGTTMSGFGESEVYVGYAGSAAVVQTGGNMFPGWPNPGANVLLLGYNPLSNGSYTLSGTGQVSAYEIYIGKVPHQYRQIRGAGQFVQDGGTVSLVHATDAKVSLGADGSYDLHSGQLLGPYVRLSGGTFRQGGGTIRLIAFNNDNGFHVGSGYPGPNGSVLEISGGTLEANQIGVGNWPVDGEVRVIGNAPVIGIHSYVQGATGTLRSVVGAAGLAPIDVHDSGSGYLPGEAYLGGTWRVQDDGAALGRFNVITTAAGIFGSFNSVSLPGADWSWGIENGKTLWVEHVPEPTMLPVLTMLCVGLAARRQASAGSRDRPRGMRKGNPSSPQTLPARPEKPNFLSVAHGPVWATHRE